MHHSPNHRNVSGTNHNYLPTPHFAQFPKCNVFLIMINADYFTSGTGPDILNVLEDCIIFLIYAARVLYNYLTLDCLVKGGHVINEGLENSSKLNKW